ncbi:MAG: carbamoyltransferase N-terminal domain-containing protein, partial [Blastocatellia bacterium]
MFDSQVRTEMNILGISGQDRNASAALVSDGRVVAAIEEEKLSRIPNVGMAYCGGLPFRAMEFCLDRGNIQIGDVDYLAYYTRPLKQLLRSAGLRNIRTMLRPAIGTFGRLPGYFLDGLAGLKQHSNTKHKIEAIVSNRARFVAIDHQVCHASAAFYPSGFDRSAVAVAGNMGDLTSMALMTGLDAKLGLQAEARFPHSLGMVYTAVTSALGFGAGRENKTMWLALTGEDEFAPVFRDLMQIDPDGLPYVNQVYFKDLAKGSPSLSDPFFRRTGLEHERKNGKIGSVHRNIACSLQLRLETVLCEVVARYRERSGHENLCLAGGVASNSLANAAIERDAGYRQVFVEPVPGNAGCSIGAALYIWHDMLGHARSDHSKHSLLLGPKFDDEVIKPVLDNCKLDYKYFLTEDRQIDEVARLLAQGKIIGRFGGALEFGPRALGSRCILASPATGIMRDNLNQYIKHR